MTHNRSPPRAPDGPPILDCPVCSPKRPMIVKNIRGLFRNRRPTVIYECATCGATQEGPPELLADLAECPQPAARTPDADAPEGQT